MDGLILREDAFGEGPAWGPLCPVSEVHGIFSNRDLTFTSQGGRTKSNSL